MVRLDLPPSTTVSQVQAENILSKLTQSYTMLSKSVESLSKKATLLESLSKGYQALVLKAMQDGEDFKVTRGKIDQLILGVSMHILDETDDTYPWPAVDLVFDYYRLKSSSL